MARTFRRIFVRPVEPGAGQQLNLGAIDPGVHAISIELELVSQSSPLGVTGLGFGSGNDIVQGNAALSQHEMEAVKRHPIGTLCRSRITH